MGAGEVPFFESIKSITHNPLLDQISMTIDTILPNQPCLTLRLSHPCPRYIRIPELLCMYCTASNKAPGAVR